MTDNIPFSSSITVDFDVAANNLITNNNITAGANVAANNLIANTILIGNTTINSYVNSSYLSISNSTSNIQITVAVFNVGNTQTNATLNSSSLAFNGVPIITNTTALVPNTINMGNSIANSSSNSTISSIANATANSQLGPGTLALQGAGSNTGFTVGTSSITANGYSFLPNGLLLQWGRCNVSSTSANIALPTAFPTALFSVTVTGNTNPGTSNTAGTNLPVVTAIPNTSVFTVQSGNATASNCFYIAVGH